MIHLERRLDALYHKMKIESSCECLYKKAVGGEVAQEMEQFHK